MSGRLVDYIAVERVEAGVGFCIIVDDSAANLALDIIQRYQRQAWVIGAVVEDKTKGVEIARPRLIGHGKRFRAL